ncbi:hypothetical protein JB92DRAFT_3104090 [Gautieria morchelliformis]|nr:hypothetical protein JB92DRAFT_3104090 [Gautieria morchelliformis]
MSAASPGHPSPSSLQFMPIRLPMTFHQAILKMSPMSILANQAMTEVNLEMVMDTLLHHLNPQHNLQHLHHGPPGGPPPLNLANPVLPTQAPALTQPIAMLAVPPVRLLPDDTVVCVVGHIFAPPSGTILLDIVSLSAFLGDPTSEQYEDKIPDDTSVAVWAMGVVLNNAEYASDSQICTFNIAVADYVCDGTKSFVLECLYDGNSVWWNCTPTPNVNTTIYMYGTLRGVNGQGNLRVAMANVTLNVGPAMLSPSTPRRGRNPPSPRDGP